ncbi:winged helix-turn-helix transcriptional regulator [Acinetobacter nectaris]|uniref:winged helix-turn-helix transcriptional regulator n=1 Tax=Acinetobacter nectaris TaxID=1219382 RepID=UPI001F201945|nr:helix-turn-helix domain-containing protein [Acinetobacter nectaris]MCF8999357.1 helix-turn-helix transcriptional regulator [Acinetobacter nectaris]MCF9026638.1 helix-turn-helix transcriptional regulator [Acinetobacter nectaris]
MGKLESYNIHCMDCPARLFFEALADKWVLLIITTLEKDAQHFNLLKKSIEGISPKVLSQKLKHLERYGFVQRTVLDTSPIRVEYTLTEFGKDFSKTAYQMKSWAENNISKVLAAQKEYDKNHI